MSYDHVECYRCAGILPLTWEDEDTAHHEHTCPVTSETYRIEVEDKGDHLVLRVLDGSRLVEERKISHDDFESGRVWVLK